MLVFKGRVLLIGLKEKGREEKRERGRCGREVRRKGQWQVGEGENGVGPMSIGSTFKSNRTSDRPILFKIRLHEY